MPEAKRGLCMTSKDDESLGHLMANCCGEVEFTRKHIKALLRNPQMRESILARMDDEELESADVDDLSPSDFDALCDAAQEAFGEREAPVAKTYTVEGGCGPYTVEIIGVRGAYMVCASEYDDKGMFESLKEAKACVDLNWLGKAKEEVT